MGPGEREMQLVHHAYRGLMGIVRIMETYQEAGIRGTEQYQIDLRHAAARIQNLYQRETGQALVPVPGGQSFG